MSFEVRAVHRGCQMGAYKARLVLALIRGRNASQALDTLRNDRHRASRYIYKVLASAVANALQNPSVRANRLVVSKTWAQNGKNLPGGSRVRPGPQGRAMPIVKRTCHVHIYVADPQAMGADTSSANQSNGGEE